MFLMILLLLGAKRYLVKYFKETTVKIAPTIIIKINKILTDFRYFCISGFFSFFEKTPAPNEITT